MSEESDNVEREEVQLAAKAFLNIILSGRIARSRNVWKPLMSLPALQYFPRLEKQFLLQ